MFRLQTTRISLMLCCVRSILDTRNLFFLSHDERKKTLSITTSLNRTRFEWTTSVIIIPNPGQDISSHELCRRHVRRKQMEKDMTLEERQEKGRKQGGWKGNDAFQKEKKIYSFLRWSAYCVLETKIRGGGRLRLKIAQINNDKKRK